MCVLLFDGIESSPCVFRQIYQYCPSIQRSLRVVILLVIVLGLFGKGFFGGFRASCLMFVSFYCNISTPIKRREDWRRPLIFRIWKDFRNTEGHRQYTLEKKSTMGLTLEVSDIVSLWSFIQVCHVFLRPRGLVLVIIRPNQMTSLESWMTNKCWSFKARQWRNTQNDDLRMEQGQENSQLRRRSRFRALPKVSHKTPPI